MKSRNVLILLLSLALCSCATFDQKELGQMRARGVSESVVSKLNQGRPLEPRDVIELTRRHVSDDLIIRQIDHWGLIYPLSHRDVAQLRQAGVHPAVMDALVRTSEDLHRHSDPRGMYADPFYGDPSFYGPGYGYYGSYPFGWYGGAGLIYEEPRFYSHHRRW